MSSWKTKSSWGLRLLAVVLTVCWAGGLAVYGGLVLPTLHDQMGVTDAAWVTREVSRGLNLLGLASLGAWLGSLLLERPGRLGWALLAVSAVLLLVQFVLHPALAARMDAGRVHRGGFYPLHRAYLLATTVQWTANLGLIARSLRPPGACESGRDL